MIEIKTIVGNDIYAFDEASQKIFKNGVVLPSVSCEPIYSCFDESDVPKFSGIFLKDRNAIVSLSGVISPITDTDQIR